MLGLTRIAALDAARYGIRVNAICPGVIETRLGVPAFDEGAYRAGIQRFTDRIPLRRIGEPDDVAAVVAFLASDDARHVTGAGWLIDGGQTLQSWANAPEFGRIPEVHLIRPPGPARGQRRPSGQKRPNSPSPSRLACSRPSSPPARERHRGRRLRPHVSGPIGRPRAGSNRLSSPSKDGPRRRFADRARGCGSSALLVAFCDDAEASRGRSRRRRSRSRPEPRPPGTDGHGLQPSQISLALRCSPHDLLPRIPGHEHRPLLFCKMAGLPRWRRAGSASLVRPAARGERP